MANALLKKTFETEFMRKEFIKKMEKKLNSNMTPSLKLNSKKPSGNIEFDRDLAKLEIEILKDWNNLPEHEKIEFMEMCSGDAESYAAENKDRLDTKVKEIKEKVISKVPGIKGGKNK